jgi:hypothetical protein
MFLLAICLSAGSVFDIVDQSKPIAAPNAGRGLGSRPLGMGFIAQNRSTAKTQSREATRIPPRLGVSAVIPLRAAARSPLGMGLIASFAGHAPGPRLPTGLRKIR